MTDWASGHILIWGKNFHQNCFCMAWQWIIDCYLIHIYVCQWVSKSGRIGDHNKRTISSSRAAETVIICLSITHCMLYQSAAGGCPNVVCCSKCVAGSVRGHTRWGYCVISFIHMWKWLQTINKCGVLAECQLTAKITQIFTSFHFSLHLWYGELIEAYLNAYPLNCVFDLQSKINHFQT